MCLLITQQEVTELFTQLQQRPRLWVGKDRLWVRRNREGVNQFALKVVDGEPNGLCRVHIVALHGDTSQGEAERLVGWLLRRLTTFGYRERLTEFLTRELKRHTDESTSELAERIARTICVLEGDIDTVGEEKAVSAPPEPAEVQTPQTPQSGGAKKQKSLFLQRLLK